MAETGLGPVYVTTAAGDEAVLATHAIQRGVRTIVAVGGDGTCSRIAGAILGSGTDCRLAVLPSGTGNDFAKTLGVTGFSPRQISDLIATGARRRMDVGRVDGRNFINSCGFGFDASVLEATREARWLSGNAVYIYSALRMLFSYRGFSARVAESGAAAGANEYLLMLTVSNGRFLGGAFMIAPRASVHDGVLDVCYVNDLSVPRRLRLFARAMRGTHQGLNGVMMRRIDKLTLQCETPPLMEIDGELHEASSCEVRVECLPNALSVVAAPGAPG